MSLNLATRIVTTTPYNIVNSDTVVFINRPSAISSVVLPSTGIDDDDKKRSFYIKDFSGNAGKFPITITSAGGKTIDGGTFALINGGYAYVQVIYDGTNWKII
jgi:hypothetical protein